MKIVEFKKNCNRTISFFLIVRRVGKESKKKARVEERGERSA